MGCSCHPELYQRFVLGIWILDAYATALTAYDISVDEREHGHA